ncbi:DHH phosphoesterase [Hymenopellis radicata]|nr:DHH phosphoesterase [Hymenopellis radicata]
MAAQLRRLSSVFKSNTKLVQPASMDNALTKFLVHSKAKYLESNDSKEYLMVMGNEAGDLDSIASSITYAWLQSQTRSAIPYIQISKDDLALRPENIYALSLAGITDPKSQLLVPDDVAPFPATKFALVDHNRLGSQFASNDSLVEAIIDHHEDERHHLDANPRTISPAGSCSSHIALLCPSTLPPELATLLLCAILIDTNGLKPGGKALQVDLDAVARLLPLISPSVQSTDLHNIPSLKALSDDLAERKADVSSLSPRDLLRRDYKEYTFTLNWHDEKPSIKAGLSTVPLRLKDWGTDGKLLDAGKAYMQERGLSVLGVLTSFHKKKLTSKGKGKHAREMAWLVLSEVSGLDECLWRGLEADEELKVVKHDSFKVGETGDVRVRVYKQGNANATRKATAPILKRILEAEE